MSYKIISKFIKDISFEIPNTQAFVMLEKEIPNYSLNFDKINSLGFEVTKTVENGVMELKKIYSFYDPSIKYKYI